MSNDIKDIKPTILHDVTQEADNLDTIELLLNKAQSDTNGTDAETDTPIKAGRLLLPAVKYLINTHCVIQSWTNQLRATTSDERQH
jgi:hypothetical protein